MYPFPLAILPPFAIFLTGMIASAAPEFSQSHLFAGGTGGYYGYRIPALTTTASGALLAFCEGRKNSLSDQGDIDILLRRSTDQGVTWSAQQVVVDEGGTAPIAFGNPAPVLDESTGFIHLLCCRNNQRVFHVVSTDDGLTWSAPVEITTAVKPPSWFWYATGPVHGIQLKRGLHAGRLVIPCDHVTEPNLTTGIYGSHVIFSDDHGTTWQLGANSEATNAIWPNETTCVELTDSGTAGESKIYFNTRDQAGRMPGCRGQTFSLDSGATFNPEVFTYTPFSCPVVQGSLLRLRATDEGAPSDCILFSCPNSSARTRLSVWSSSDETLSWSGPKLIYAGPSAYSDMARTVNGNIALLYENGVGHSNERITIARFNEAWLNQSGVPAEAPGPAFWNLEEKPAGQSAATSLDAIHDIHPANLGLHLTAQLPFPVVAGAPQFGNGVALGFAGNGGLRITDAKSGNRFDFGPAQSFTLEVVCRIPAGSSQVGSLIAKDFAPFSPSWWLRVEGGKARFLVCDGAVEPVVTSTAFINDGQWHHVAAVRDATVIAAKQLRIYIDGQLSGTVADTTTSSFANGQDLWLGRYNNGTRLLTGEIDLARITPQALAPAGFVGPLTQFDGGAPQPIYPTVTLDLYEDFLLLQVRAQSIPLLQGLQLMSSDNLIRWIDIPSETTISTLPDGLSSRVDRIETPMGLHDRRFFRYRAVAAP
jgi:sialidase-1